MNTSLSDAEAELADPARSVVEEYYETKSEPLPWGEEFGRVYTEVGNTVSYDNNVIHVSTMLTLVSRALRQTKIRHENRVLSPVLHTLAIQKSGSGKSPALDFARMVGEMAGYDVRQSGDLTSAGLIGGVRDGDVHPGIAKRYDIIGFDEASTLFRIASGSYDENFAEHLNNILDGRKVTKDLATGNLEYKPKCALTGVTYPPDDIDYERFMNNGTLSRFFIFYRPIDFEFYRSTGEKILRGARETRPDDPNDHDTTEQLMVDIQRLGTVIKAIQQNYDPGFQFDHRFGEETQQLVIDTVYGTYEQYPDYVQELVEPDLNRMVENALKLGAVMAALDYCSQVVSDSHMESAAMLIERSWRQSLDFFESHYQPETIEDEPALNDSTRRMLKALFRDDPKTQDEVADEIDRSKRMIREYAAELESLGLIDEVTLDGKKGYKLKTN